MMLRIRTQFRLAYLAAWQPPPSVERTLAIHDGGTIDVLLSCGPFRDALVICPKCRLRGDVFGVLNGMARILMVQRDVAECQAAQAARTHAGARVRRAVPDADAEIDEYLERKEREKAEREGGRPR